VQSLFPNQTLAAAHGSFDLLPAGIAGLFVAVGLLVSAGIYIARRVSPARFVGATGFMHSIQVFLENRWYINAIYYKVFVNAPLAASSWLGETFELEGLFRINDLGRVAGISLSQAGNWIDVKVIDGIVNGVSAVGLAFSRAARKLQSGVTEQYISVLALGVLVLLVALLLAWGVKIT
jgi:hypothetical protein